MLVLVPVLVLVLVPVLVPELARVPVGVPVLVLVPVLVPVLVLVPFLVPVLVLVPARSRPGLYQPMILAASWLRLAPRADASVVPPFGARWKSCIFLKSLEKSGSSCISRAGNHAES